MDDRSFGLPPAVIRMRARRAHAALRDAGAELLSLLAQQRTAMAQFMASREDGPAHMEPRRSVQ
jgi:hypothetical protein